MTISAIDTAQVGWIGVGKMGSRMAARLLESGRTVAVFDTVPANAACLPRRSLEICAAPEDLARKCMTIFTTIPNDTALASLVLGDADNIGLTNCMRPGSILVEMSTVSPSVSTRVSAALAARGILYLRAPVSGSTAMAEAGSLTIFGSGDASAWDAVLPLFELLSAKRFYLGGEEEARYMKLVVNTLVGATSSLLGEAMLLGRRGGLTSGQMMDVLTQSAVASPLIGYKRVAIENDDFTPAFSVDQMIKDFVLITEAGRAVETPMFVTNLVLQQYLAAAAAGYGHSDFFALIAWLQSLGGDCPAEHSDARPSADRNFANGTAVRFG